MRLFSYFNFVIIVFLPLALARADDEAVCHSPPAPPVLGVPGTNEHVMDPLEKALERVVTTREGTPANLDVASTYFQSKGFKCDPFSRQKGLVCTGRMEGYPNDVALIVPPDFHAENQADLILQLHGHNDAPKENLVQKLNRFKYAESLAISHRNAIMIAPFSDGHCGDFEKNLAEKEQFEKFMIQAASLAKGASLAQTDQVGPITLTGHSGAYRTLAAIVKNGGHSERVREVYLMDSAYNHAEEFSNWAAQPPHRFWSVYHEDDRDHQNVAAAIKRNLRNRGRDFYDGKSSALTPQEVRASRIGFVPTLYTSTGKPGRLRVINHNDTFTRYYSTLLSVE